MEDAFNHRLITSFVGGVIFIGRFVRALYILHRHRFNRKSEFKHGQFRCEIIPDAVEPSSGLQKCLVLLGVPTLDVKKRPGLYRWDQQQLLTFFKVVSKNVSKTVGCKQYSKCLSLVRPLLAIWTNVRVPLKLAPWVADGCLCSSVEVRMINLIYAIPLKFVNLILGELNTRGRWCCRPGSSVLGRSRG